MGIVTLNRPEALNALDQEMVSAIRARLRAWAALPEIAAVLFESSSPRGFCAGGDVRAVRAAVMAGRADAADAFFVNEYAMNLEIATYPKPTVALMAGIAMGGGLGIGGHARVRVVAEGARLAMPEAAIGLMCDVGINARLAQIPEHRALAFEMLGLPVGAGAAIMLNLADHLVADADFPRIRGALVGAADLGQAGLEQAIAGFARPQPALPDDLVLADRLADCFARENAEAIVAAVFARAAADAETENWRAVLMGRCPASLEAIVQNYRAAVRDPEIGSVLARDLALSQFLVRRGDFSEGVRAVLVDKDHSPVWSPASLAQVKGDEIAAILRGN